MFYLTPSLVDGVHNVSEDSTVLAQYLEGMHPYYDCKPMEDSLQWGEQLYLLLLTLF